jgi:hypothetical protein
MKLVELIAEYIANKFKAIYSGEKQVGDSAKLGGKSASEYQELLQNGVNISTVNGVSLLSGTDIVIESSGGLGVEQTWQNVTSERALGVTYTNDTGKPILVSVNGETDGTSYFKIYIDGILADIMLNYNQYGIWKSVQAIVPNGSTYKVTSSNYGISGWVELR